LFVFLPWVSPAARNRGLHGDLCSQHGYFLLIRRTLFSLTHLSYTPSTRRITETKCIFFNSSQPTAPRESEWETGCLDLGVFEPLLSLLTPKLIDDVTSVALAPQHVLVAHQPFQPHRSSGVDPTCADSNLRTKTVPKPIRKPRAGVPESPSRVHPSDKRRSALFGFRDD